MRGNVKNVIRVLQDKGFIIIKNFFNTHTICELVKKLMSV